jgi:hypothetical protein
LRTLEFANAERLWPLCSAVDAASHDALFELIGTFSPGQISPQLTLLLPLLTGNPGVRLQCILPAVDASAGSLAQWDSLAASADLEQFATQLWRCGSFAPVVERLLFRPSTVLTPALAEIAAQFPVTSANFALFGRFFADAVAGQYLDAADHLAQALLPHAHEFDFGLIEIDPEALFAFVAKHGFVDSLLGVVALICARNNELEEVLRDEIAILGARPGERPHIILLDICLNTRGLEDALRRYCSACTALPNCEATSACVFPLFDARSYNAGQVFRATFRIAPVLTPAEKTVLKRGAQELPEKEFLAFVAEWGKTVAPVCPRPADVRKVYLLVKWRPDCRDRVLELVRIPKSHAMPASRSSEALRKYAAKIYAEELPG